MIRLTTAVVRQPKTEGDRDEEHESAEAGDSAARLPPRAARRPVMVGQAVSAGGAVEPADRRQEAGVLDAAAGVIALFLEPQFDEHAMPILPGCTRRAFGRRLEARHT